jgi:MoCo/4Fe-4S cofactor protein with predicted Tat translocation signal
MGMNKKYWTGLEELDNTPAFQEAVTTEFKKDQSVDEFLSDSKLSDTNTGRRDFLKFMGFSLTAATLAACETPVVKSIPYVIKPEEITPGVANFYATTYYDGNDYGSLLVKTREGRPIHIKGNKTHGLGNGALNSRINASVVGLYDTARLQGPMIGENEVTWEQLDTELSGKLASASSIRIVSGTVISPSTKRAVAEFTAKYGADKVKHVQYDAFSYSGITSANQQTFGKAVVPVYDFSKAKVIVSLDADFLGSWLTSNFYIPQYAERRRPEGSWMNKHFQVESRMSLTGSNADDRYPVKPSEIGKVAAALYGAVTGNGSASFEGVDVAAMAKALKSNTGSSLVVSGSNDPNVQLIVNAINKALGNYGSTIDIDNPLNLYQGNDAAMAGLVTEMNNGGVGALIVYGCNPSYDWANADAFNAGLAKVGVTVSLNLYADETGSKCSYKAPDHHYLESWNDLSPVAGRVDLVQPTINKLFNTRQAGESFAKWAGNTIAYYDYVRQTHGYGFTPATMNASTAWNEAVQRGTFAGASAVAAMMAMPVVADSAYTGTPTAPVAELAVQSGIDLAAPVMAVTSSGVDVSSAISAVNAITGGEWELVTYQKVTMGTGNHAGNPFLQETPDPITKVTWDNYVTMSPADVKEKGWNLHLGMQEPATMVDVTANGKTITLPVFPAPGQKRGTIGIAVGYGRGANAENIGKAAYQTGEKGNHLVSEGEKPTPIGKNAFSMSTVSNGCNVQAVYNVTVAQVDGDYHLATTQTQNTVMGRDSVVKETVIAEYLKEKGKKKGEASYNKMPSLVVHKDVNGDGKVNAQDKVHVREADLWKAHPVEVIGHRWGLTIDLNSCIGCGTCVTACHTENNVPVVGKDEVVRHRDMHWLRIDRYFTSDYATVEETAEKKELGTIAAYGDMENAAENPRAVHMPMMCQHCNHAPCETVCPVAATTHSNEGLNNMAYNRCIGTRYCANNCPYKVRRFNWFNYVTNPKFNVVNPAQDDSLRMVLNPDVTVRTRGVMEKCSMCQQRIQSGKNEAKKNGTPVQDGAFTTACAEACPTNAIVFGDLNDNATQNYKRSVDVRSYHALEEVGIQPNIFYMTKVRNIESSEA